MDLNKYSTFPMTFHANRQIQEQALAQAASGKTRIIVAVILNVVMTFAYYIALAVVESAGGVLLWLLAMIAVMVISVIMLVRGIMACARGNTVANRYACSKITLHSDRITGMSFPSAEGRARYFSLRYGHVEKAWVSGKFGLNLTIRTKGGETYHGLAITDAEIAVRKIMDIVEKKRAAELPPVQAVIYCPHCGAPQPEDAKFCCQCGKETTAPPADAPVPPHGPVEPLIAGAQLTCPLCHGEMRPNVKNCIHCGTEFITRPWTCRCGRENFYRTANCVSCGCKSVF